MASEPVLRNDSREVIAEHGLLCVGTVEVPPDLWFLLLRSKSMNLVVVALLAVLWAAILLPGVLREHRSRSPLTTVDRFERSMVILARRQAGARAPARRQRGRRVLVADPRELTEAATRARAVRRRRRTVGRLAGAATLAGILAVVLGDPFWWLLASAVLGLVGYLALLARNQANEAEARRKTRHLRPRTAELVAAGAHEPRAESG